MATMGPISWVIIAENPSQKLRSYTVGLAQAVSYVLLWVVAYTAPYFVNPRKMNWGAKYGWFWFGGCCAIALFTWLYVPETKDRTLEEIDELFAKRIPTRQFASFRTTRLDHTSVDEDTEAGVSYIKTTEDQKC
jgi:SP family sugar:H+ symporter-like MFS transporter